jgi:hypothetical protein
MLTMKKKNRKLTANQVSFKWPNKDVEELATPIQLSVITKAPEKYVLLDMETGQIYVGSNQNNPYDPNFKLWIEQKI